MCKRRAAVSSLPVSVALHYIFFASIMKLFHFTRSLGNINTFVSTQISSVHVENAHTDRWMETHLMRVLTDTAHTLQWVYEPCVASDASGSDEPDLRPTYTFTLIRTEVWKVELHNTRPTQRFSRLRKGQSCSAENKNQILSCTCFLPASLQWTFLTLEFIFSSLSWPRVCYNILYVWETMPAVDYSKITEMVNAEWSAWTSCWAELKVM